MSSAVCIPGGHPTACGAAFRRGAARLCGAGKTACILLHCDVRRNKRVNSTGCHHYEPRVWSIRGRTLPYVRRWEVGEAPPTCLGAMHRSVSVTFHSAATAAVQPRRVAAHVTRRSITRPYDLRNLERNTIDTSYWYAKLDLSGGLIDLPEKTDKISSLPKPPEGPPGACNVFTWSPLISGGSKEPIDLQISVGVVGVTKS